MEIVKAFSPVWPVTFSKYATLCITRHIFGKTVSVTPLMRGNLSFEMRIHYGCGKKEKKRRSIRRTAEGWPRIYAPNRAAPDRGTAARHRLIVHEPDNGGHLFAWLAPR